MSRYAARHVGGLAGWYVLAGLLSVLTLVPLLWMLTVALKSNAAVFAVPPQIVPSEWHWENFVKGPQQIHFPLLFLNSAIITTLSVTGGVASSMLVGYGLSRIRFVGRRVWFYCFVFSMMLPPIVTLFPLFGLFRTIGWYDTWLPLIVPSYLGGSPIYIFLARQFYMSIPRELDEAAKMDGAGHWVIFTRIMVPLTRPLWITMAIMGFLASWNEYLEPLVYLYSNDKWPLAVGMASFLGAFAGNATTPWNLYMATNLLYIVPPVIVFFVAQRYFMQGLSALAATSSK